MSVNANLMRRARRPSDGGFCLHRGGADEHHARASLRTHRKRGVVGPCRAVPAPQAAGPGRRGCPFPVIGYRSPRCPISHGDARSGDRCHERRGGWTRTSRRGVAAPGTEAPMVASRPEHEREGAQPPAAGGQVGPPSPRRSGAATHGASAAPYRRQGEPAPPQPFRPVRHCQRGPPTGEFHPPRTGPTTRAWREGGAKRHRTPESRRREKARAADFNKGRSPRAPPPHRLARGLTPPRVRGPPPPRPTSAPPASPLRTAWAGCASGSEGCAVPRGVRKSPPGGGAQVPRGVRSGGPPRPQVGALA